ncbi:MAG: hypothetical protein KIT79_15875 [Deltaproteobacteria bacterium]|nr:hypothetical protein [Deltaproteobacteria bacterium]
MNFNSIRRTGLALAAITTLGLAACSDSKGITLEPGKYTIGGVVGNKNEPASVSPSDFAFYPDWYYWADITIGADLTVSGRLTTFEWLPESLPDVDDFIEFHDVTGEVTGDTFTATAEDTYYGDITVTGTVSADGTLSISTTSSESDLVATAIGVKNGDETAIACGYSWIDVETWNGPSVFVILNDGELLATVAGPYLKGTITGEAIFDPDLDYCFGDVEGCLDTDASSATLVGQVDYEGMDSEVDVELDLTNSYAENVNVDVGGTLIQIYADDDGGDLGFHLDADTDDCWD